MVEEKVKFVWEQNIGVDIKDAEKRRKYKDMKNLYESMTTAVKNLEKIKRLSEDAERYGVLEVRIDDCCLSVYFNCAVLEINSKTVKRVLNKEITKEDIKENWKEILDELIDYQKEQIKKMEEYFKEAEQYLIVEVEKDEEYNDDD